MIKAAVLPLDLPEPEDDFVSLHNVLAGGWVNVLLEVILEETVVLAIQAVDDQVKTRGGEDGGDALAGDAADTGKGHVQ